MKIRKSRHLANLVDSLDIWNPYRLYLQFWLMIQLIVIWILTSYTNSDALSIDYLYISTILITLVIIYLYSPSLFMFLVLFILVFCIFSTTMVCESISQQQINQFVALFINTVTEESHRVWNIPPSGIVTIRDVLSMPRFGPSGGQDMFFRIVDLSGGWNREDVLNNRVAWAFDLRVLLPPDNRRVFFGFDQTVWYGQLMAAYKPIS